MGIFDEDFVIEREDGKLKMGHKAEKMEDSIENKEGICGKYEDQRVTIARCISALDELAKTVRAHGGLTEEERFDYSVLMLKITRSVTAPNSTDSYLDLANYARLICRAKTGIDIIDELCKVHGHNNTKTQSIVKDE